VHRGVGAYRIEAAPMKGMAAQDAAERYPSAPRDAVLAHRNRRIFRTRWLEAACAGDSRRGMEEGRQCVFIDAMRGSDEAIAESHGRAPSSFPGSFLSI
jgi:hypothetical protein